VGELGLNVGELMQQTAQNLSFGLAFLQEASVSASGGIHFRDTFNTPERTPFDAGYKYTSLDALKQKTRILIVSYAGFWIVLDFLKHVAGGGGEIRTHGRLTPSLVFKTSALNHSATPPLRRLIRQFRSAACQFIFD
jgi:hypothetical protein